MTGQTQNQSGSQPHREDGELDCRRDADRVAAFSARAESGADVNVRGLKKDWRDFFKAVVQVRRVGPST